jgi:hypothetical protein
MFSLFFDINDIIRYSKLQHRTRTDICGKYQNFYIFKNTTPCHIPPAAGYANCETGTWSKEDQQGTVKRINYFRNLSGLSELKLSTNKKILDQEMKGALLCSQTDKLQHGGWTKKEKCYSDDANEGTGNSNIAMKSKPTCVTDSVTVFIDDIGIDGMGHRNWLLDPALPEIAAGIYQRFTDIRVMGFPNQATDYLKPTILAYPNPGYFPMLNDFRRPIPGDWTFAKPGVYNLDGSIATVTCDGKNVLQKYKVYNSFYPMFPAVVQMTVDTSSLKHGSECLVKVNVKPKAISFIYAVTITNCSKSITDEYPADPDSIECTGRFQKDSKTNKCVCREGYRNVKGKCDACEEGYEGDAFNGTCTKMTKIQCPANSVPNADQTQCVCKEAYRSDKGFCDACAEGYEGNAAAGQCTKIVKVECTGNTELSADKKSCVCKVGYKNNKGTCDACADGYEGDASKGKCTKKVLKCSGNTELNADQTKCVCKVGYVNKKGTCDACASGYEGDASKGKCKKATLKCSGNTELNADKTACVCKVGYVNKKGTCDACAAGYAGKASSGKCAKCSGISYPNSDQSKCVCPTGYANKKGTCDVCASGYVGVASASNCTKCSGNFQANSAKTGCVCKAGYGGLLCEACPIGQYSKGGSLSACTLCPSGYTTKKEKQTSKSACSVKVKTTKQASNDRVSEENSAAEDKGGLSGVYIGLIVAGCVVVVAAIIIVFVIVRKKANYTKLEVEHV